MKPVDLSIVVPVYNNAGTLPELIDRLLAVADGLAGVTEIILVDDGSTDASPAILRSRAAADKRLQVLALDRNYGGQAALCAGFDHAGGRRVVCLDADLENCPEDVPVLLAALDRGHDLACAVRQRRARLWRHLASWLLNVYVRRRMAVPVRDVGCGMRAMDARLVRDLAREGERRRMLTPLLIARAHAVVEVPVRPGQAPRSGGHSLLSLFGIAADFFLLSGKRPFVAAALVAGLAKIAGIGLLIVAAVRGSAMLGIYGLALVLAGMLGVLVSLAGEYLQRIYVLARDEPLYRLREHDVERRSGADDAERVVRGRFPR